MHTNGQRPSLKNDNMNKHIDPEPDRRYLFRNHYGTLVCGTVIEATDRYIRIQWNAGMKEWYAHEMFQPYSDGTYTGRIQALEELQPHHG